MIAREDDTHGLLRSIANWDVNVPKIVQVESNPIQTSDAGWTSDKGAGVPLISCGHHRYDDDHPCGPSFGRQGYW